MVKQETFMMLKPDAFSTNCVDEVLKDLEENGLHVEQSKTVKVDMDTMKVLLEHYQGVIDTMDKSFDFAGKLFTTFYYGPHYIMPMKITYEGTEDIITYSRKLVGKTNPQQAEKGTIRGDFSDDNYDKADAGHRLVNNVIHASDSHESATRELNIWKDILNS